MMTAKMGLCVRVFAALCRIGYSSTQHMRNRLLPVNLCGTSINGGKNAESFSVIFGKNYVKDADLLCRACPAEKCLSVFYTYGDGDHRLPITHIRETGFEKKIDVVIDSSRCVGRYPGSENEMRKKNRFPNEMTSASAPIFGK